MHITWKKSRRVLFLAVIFLTFFYSGSVYAASGISLKYDGKTLIYNDKSVKYILDGKTINLNKTPGIIINGYSLVSYKEVFQTGIGATCKYDSSTGVITIKKFNHTVKMTLGSRTAYVDGKKATLPIAPRLITYVSQKSSKIVVPARFVAEALQYTYNWYSDTSTVKITSPYQIYFDGKWYLYKGENGSVTIDGKKVNLSQTPGFIIDNTPLVPAKLVFTSKGIGASYQYDSAKKEVTLKKGDTTILFTLGSTTAYVNGEKKKLTSAPKTIKDNKTKKSVIMIPVGFTAEALGLTYNWNNTTRTSIITSKKETPAVPEAPAVEKTLNEWKSGETLLTEGFTNLLNSMVLISKGSQEIVRLTGKIPIDAVMSVDPDNANMIYIDMNGMQNALGEVFYLPLNTKLIKSITVSTRSDYQTRIILEKTDACSYFSQAKDNINEIIFSDDTVLPNTDTNTNTGDPSVGSSSGVRIKKPDSIMLSQITDEDQYYKNQFLITIPGNNLNFFESNPIVINNNTIINTSYALDSNGNTVITIQTDKLQGYKILEDAEYLNIMVDDPNKIYSRIIVLDPGHGKEKPGTIASNGVQEKNITLSILYTYIKQYFNDKGSTVKAYWTRTADDNPSFDDRALMADRIGADVFISLHMNSATVTSANGTETYYSPNNNTTEQSGLNSKKLAAHFQDNLPSLLGLSKTRGVKANDFYVCDKNTVPAILIELGFVTNSSDLSKLTDPAFQKLAAQSIYELTEELFDLYPTGR